MKLLFSEARSDYANYIFPYAIWAIPEPGEPPSRIFACGFLPSSLQLERYYMCRHVRVRLDAFTPSSENRRVMRKCSNIGYRLVPRSEFAFNAQQREFCKDYADIKFGKDVMTHERLDALFNSRLVTHVLLFEDPEVDKQVGLVTLYLEEPNLVYYYYAFYDLSYYKRNLGMFMMTSAVDYFARNRMAYIYLGTCYSRNALYKTQFAGAEFFNGFCWSQNLKELKYLITRDKAPVTQHLIETREFCDRFYHGDFAKISDASRFRVDCAADAPAPSSTDESSD
ncbi:MAG: hypothetical protein D6743_13635 [Calditrichaeota bacterium]|nr:MAG: hypothetical protein D6743_13635 [Calditrichota bacterium]